MSFFIFLENSLIITLGKRRIFVMNILVIQTGYLEKKIKNKIKR